MQKFSFSISRERFAERLAFLSLLALGLLVFLGQASLTTVPATDAADHAAMSLAVTAKGLIPALPIGSATEAKLWDGAFNDHPWTYFYLQGHLMRLLGPSTWSARVMPALVGLGSIASTFLLARFLLSPILALIAGLILIFTKPVWVDVLNNHMGHTVVMGVVVSLIFSHHRRYYWMGLASGLGMALKNPVALAVFPALAVEMLWNRSLRQDRIQIFLAACLALGIGMLPWVVTAGLAGPQWVQDYWVRQVWGTSVEGRGTAGTTDFFFFFRQIRSEFVFGTFASLVAGLLFAWQEIKSPRITSDRPPELQLQDGQACSLLQKIYFLVGELPFSRVRTWIFSFQRELLVVGVLLGVLSLMRFKFGHYILPVYALLAVLASSFWKGMISRRVSRLILRGFPSFVLLIAILLVCTPLRLSPESYPALRRWMAIIQGDGRVTEPVYVVEPGLPYANGGDYSHLIEFYTAHRTLRKNCNTLKEILPCREGCWVLGQSVELQKCFGTRSAAHSLGASAVFQLYDQLLIRFQSPVQASIYSKPNGISQAPSIKEGSFQLPIWNDLTLLERDLLVAVDGKRPNLPADRYTGPWVPPWGETSRGD